MEGLIRSQNGEWMIRTLGKIDAGKGIDLFQSRGLTERSRDNETAGDTRRRHKVTQENAR